MRILSFSKRWEKLDQDIFSTFRFPRKDKDWYIGEVVQIYYKSRSPHREKLFNAVIIGKVSKLGATHSEAKKDGFSNAIEMERWMIKTYGEAKTWERWNKLTLQRLV